MPAEIVVGILLAPIVVYIIARIVSSAYFSAKYDHMKRIIKHANHQTSDDKRPGDDR